MAGWWCYFQEQCLDTILLRIEIECVLGWVQDDFPAVIRSSRLLWNYIHLRSSKVTWRFISKFETLRFERDSGLETNVKWSATSLIYLPSPDWFFAPCLCIQDVHQEANTEPFDLIPASYLVNSVLFESESKLKLSSFTWALAAWLTNSVNLIAILDVFFNWY